MDESIRRMERALTVISADGPDADMADLAARLGSAYYFAGDLDRSFDRTEQAPEIAESLLLPDVLARSFIVKSFIADSRSRPEESLAFLNHALKVASEHDLASAALRAHYNLADASLQRDRHEDELEHLAEALALARKNGDRVQEWMTVCEMTYPLYMLGRWEELLPALAEVPEEQLGRIGTLVSPLASVLQIHLHRGELNEASRLFNRFAELDASKEVQARAGYPAVPLPSSAPPAAMQRPSRRARRRSRAARYLGAEASASSRDSSRRPRQRSTWTNARSSKRCWPVWRACRPDAGRRISRHTRSDSVHGSPTPRRTHDTRAPPGSFASSERRSVWR